MIFFMDDGLYEMHSSLGYGYLCDRLHDFDLFVDV